MSTRNQVITIYPYAYAEKWKQRYSKDEWTIWNNDKGTMSSLGKGSTRKEAWDNALSKLKTTTDGKL